MNNKERKFYVKLSMVFFPISLLLVLILILLYNFAIISNNAAKSVIEDDLTIETENFTYQIRDELSIMTRMGSAFSDMLNVLSIESANQALPIIGTLCDNSNAYMVVYCDTKGIGVTQSGIKVNVKKDNILRLDKGSSQYYTYIQKENIMQAEAIVSVIPVAEEDEVNGYILMYYSVSHVRKLFAQSSEFSNAFLIFSVDNGEVITTEGLNQQPTKGVTLPQLLNEMDSDIDSQKIQNAVEKMENTSLFLVHDNESKYVIGVPTFINDWYITIGFEKSLYEQKLTDEWTSIRNLITYLLILILAFIFFMVGITLFVQHFYIKHNKKLQKRANTDLLTELNNKVTTEHEIQQYIMENPKACGILFIVDIDNFKGINDTMGHAMGDTVLKRVGYYMREEFGEGNILGRVGGDEFIIFIKGLKSEFEIEAVMRKTGELFKMLSCKETVLESITFSIGAAIFPKDAASFEELYQVADQALYDAKKSGKNQLIQCKGK